MSQSKKQVRSDFNTACLVRDGYRCVMCGLRATPENWRDLLDVHHVTDRHELPGGGYVKENGVTLCKQDGPKEMSCHMKAEQFHITGTAVPGYSPEELYRKIGSSREQAQKAAERLASNG